LDAHLVYSEAEYLSGRGLILFLIVTNSNVVESVVGINIQSSRQESDKTNVLELPKEFSTRAL